MLEELQQGVLLAQRECVQPGRLEIAYRAHPSQATIWAKIAATSRT